MKTKLYLVIGLVSLAFTLKTPAQLITIEPDNYSSPTLLNHAFPQVSLVTAGANNLPIPFDVTAVYDGFGYASTGTNVFGHAGGIPFWNSDRRLRMDFASPANYLAIDFIGGEFFTNEFARLEVFSSTGNLLGSYQSAPRAADSVETMFISRPAGDIAWAVAYLPPEGGVFGRFDRLQFSVVPEPTVFALLAATALAVTNRRSRSLS